MSRVARLEREQDFFCWGSRVIWRISFQFSGVDLGRQLLIWLSLWSCSHALPSLSSCWSSGLWMRLAPATRLALAFVTSWQAVNAW